MEEIERRAEAVLAELPDYVWGGERPPVPVYEIADTYFGLRVREVSSDRMRTAPGCPQLAEGEMISGLLIPSRGEIWVNAEEAGQWPGRRRFTIGHELGHHVLHRTGQQTLFCRRATVDPEPGRDRRSPGPEARPPLPAAEEEANAFAAALLMPAEMLRAEYARDRRFERLCERFGASGAAMGRRLHAVID
jgi:IrrE N-terminal-like domain